MFQLISRADAGPVPDSKHNAGSQGTQVSPGHTVRQRRGVPGTLEATTGSRFSEQFTMCARALPVYLLWCCSEAMENVFDERKSDLPLA